MKKYIASTLLLLHSNSTLRRSVQMFEDNHFPLKTDFLTVGLEASGHHLVEMLPSDVTQNSQKRPGLQYSFPMFSCQRKNKDSNQCSIALQSIQAWKYPKYLILLRNPYMQFSSNLYRFWNTRTHSLTEMYDAWISSASQLQIFINSLVVMQLPIMVVSYENLCEQPQEHMTAFAHFLGVETHMIRRWINKIRKPKLYDIRNKLLLGSWGRWNVSDRGLEHLKYTFLKAFYSENYLKQHLHSAFTV